MPIADMNPNTSAAVTDAVCAAKIQKLLKRVVKNANAVINRAANHVATAPGGKAGVNSELAGTQAEAEAILDKLVALANAHKATNAADLTNPLA